MRNKKTIFFILAVICFLVYANSLDNTFISDDIPAILENPRISQYNRFWFAPGSLLDSLSYHICGYNPFIYHLISIILHSLNTILVFLFLTLLFKTLPSFLGACLFAVHPINSEAVAWISAKPYLLLVFFTLACYLLYYRAVNPLSKDRSFNPLWYFLSLFCFSYFIIYSYSFFSLFPLFLILSDVTFRRWKKNWKWWLPFIIIVIVRLILAKGILLERVSFMDTERRFVPGVSSFSPLVPFYWHLWLLIWPEKLALYHLGTVPKALYSYSLFLLFPIVFFLLFSFEKARELFFALSIFILFLAPTYSPMAISSLVAERYIYFPSIALSIAVAFIYERFGSQKLKKYLLALLIVIILACAVRTVIRNQDWETPDKFWRSNVKAYPGSMRARNNLGINYFNEGNYEQAMQEFNKAIEIDPTYVKTYNNRGNTYLLQGNFSQALLDFNKAIEINPRYAQAYYNRGTTYLLQGNFSQALLDFNKAIEIDPNYAIAYGNRAIAYFHRQEYRKSWEDVFKAEELGYKASPEFIDKLKREIAK